jgi:hypothetical protein
MREALTRRVRRSVAVAGFLVVGVAACAPTGGITPAAPEPGPPATTARLATLLPAGTSGQWQTNDAVWSLAYDSGVLYAGGAFTKIRPPGEAIGGPDETAAAGLAAFDSGTGAPISGFSHSVNARVNALAVSPDGNTLYAGGLFTAADGHARSKVAAFDLTRPGSPLKAWAPAFASSDQIRSIVVSPNSADVYIGGQISSINGANQAQVVKVSAADGSNESWAPAVDGPIDAMVLSPDHSQLYIGGNFNVVNGAARRALASVDVVNGKTTNYTDPVIATCGAGCVNRTDVKALVTDGTNIYAGAEGLGFGWFDGTVAVNATTGKQAWKDNCLGATQALAVIHGIMYDGSHAHDCSAVGAFGQQGINDFHGWHHLMAERTDNGGVLDWFPTTNFGPDKQPVGDELGPRAMATDGTNLFVGGFFTTVNGDPQQGLARFTPTSPAASPVAVTNAVVSRTPGGNAVLRFSGTSDKDSGVLSYRVYRDGALMTTFSNIWAHFWQSPLLTFRDSGLGTAAHSYRIDAVDEGGRVTPSATFPLTASSSGYAAAVQAAGPARYWKFDETTGTTAGDSSGHGITGVYTGSMNIGIAGAIPSGKAIHLGGTGAVNSGNGAVAAPNTYTLETWIRTTTKTGGRIAGFSNQQTGNSSSFDRQLYMANNGQLIFGVWNNGAQIVQSNKSYNDGYWHHVVTTQGPGGLQMSVDGVSVGIPSAVTTGASYSGWWRVGADNINGWPSQPTSNGFTGDVDEFAIYPGVLPISTTRSHVSAE